MANPSYPNLVPLGKITVTAAGTTVLLSINCGPLGGSVVGNTYSPPPPGNALRQIQLMADKANTGQVFLLPAGKTASANPSLILAVITPNNPAILPRGVMLANGLLPENFCLDTDTASQIVYGVGIKG